jgi:hypothetical protein
MPKRMGVILSCERVHRPSESGPPYYFRRRCKQIGSLVAGWRCFRCSSMQTLIADQASRYGFRIINGVAPADSK